MKKNILVFLVPFFIFFLSSLNQSAFATETGPQDPPGQTGGLAETGTVVNPLLVNNIQDLLAVILSAIVQIAIPFLVLAVMWVGFLFVAARGNPEKLSKAKQALFYTLLGALIILGAQTLSTILSGTISQLTVPPTTQ